MRYTGIFQHLVKDSVGVLEPTITVEQRICVRVSFHRVLNTIGLSLCSLIIYETIRLSYRLRIALK